MKPSDTSHLSRRTFLQSLGLGAVSVNVTSEAWMQNAFNTTHMTDSPIDPLNMIGAYGPWAASLVEDPPTLSFRRDAWVDIAACCSIIASRHY